MKRCCYVPIARYRDECDNNVRVCMFCSFLSSIPVIFVLYYASAPVAKQLTAVDTEKHFSRS
jgi:hypothetical protein